MSENEKNYELLTVKGLKVCFQLNRKQMITAVDGVDFDISEGEFVGLVGESGSGKTVFSLSLLRLLSSPGKIIEGQVFWRGRDILSLNDKDLRRVRGREIAMIFQNPQLSLNPVYPVGKQMVGVISLHQNLSKSDALDKAISLLRLVKIPDAERRINDYPHQFSGGMCQRIMIAMALSCQPQLLIADEPTASLDVTIQAQIMDLLLEIREKFRMSILLISHDLSLVSQMCDKTAVMYLGRIIEFADTKKLINNPLHPYTKALLESVPVVNKSRAERTFDRFREPTSAINLPRGCRFRPRCPKAFDLCGQIDPDLVESSEEGHFTACLLHDLERRDVTS